MTNRREFMVGGFGVAAAAALWDSKAATQEKVVEAGPIKTRMFWTWDHSTEWALYRQGAQTMGAFNEYTRGAATFLEDYSRLIKWCGAHHIDAVVIWGLLRDVHGGIESAKRLCELAAKCDVRILCGTGL